MPDLGHDVKEFKVFSWKLANWKKLEKKITSPEFECGGHRWWVAIVSLRFHITLTCYLRFMTGVSYCFLSEILMPLQMIPFPYISTMLIPRGHPRDGTHVLNSPLLYLILTIQPSTP